MTIDELMTEIVDIDITLDVYKLYLMKTDHTVGYTAFVEFRANYKNELHLRNTDAHGDTPEEALINLKLALLKYFGKCDCCGQYKINS